MEVLKDQYNRIHNYLRVSLTDKCNLRCSYCMPKNVQFMPSKKLMTADEIFQLAQLFVNDFGINKIRITGGEPLMRKDAPKIIEQLSQLPVQLAITTNGVFLDKYWPLLESINLSSINISLDTLNARKFKEVNKRDDFQKVYDNIFTAIQKGLNVNINTVLKLGMNDDELLDFVELTHEQKLHVKFIEFMPFNGNSWDRENVFTYQEALHIIQDKYGEAFPTKSKPNTTSKPYKLQNFKGDFSFVSTISSHFCGDCNRLRLTADGKLKNCLFGKTETDLLSILRNGGDLKPFIIENVLAKHKALGGFDKMSESEFNTQELSEREMFAIGG
ncbi:MAG: GTP 3',8-cyclase MoaA [Chitinophagales bacterium]